MTNLLKETCDALQTYGKTPSEIQWVGSDDGKYALLWSEFEALADIEYDSGYGEQEIASDLVIVGRDWWLTRSEYNGSEDWQFHTQPQLRENYEPFTRVTKTGYSWASIEEVNSPGEKIW